MLNSILKQKFCVVERENVLIKELGWGGSFVFIGRDNLTGLLDSGRLGFADLSGESGRHRKHKQISGIQ